MKIRKVLDKKMGDAVYYKYLVTLPKDIVEDSDLLNKKLKIKKQNGKIVIEQES